METLTYKDILAIPMVSEHYKKIEKGKTDGGYHGTEHINNTIDNAHRLFKVIKFDNDIKNAILIALALHDIGKSYNENKKSDNHGIIGSNITAELLKNYDIKYKAEILNAIKFHEASNPEHDLIGIAVCMLDKLDCTTKRVYDKNTEEVKPFTRHFVRFCPKIDITATGKNFIITFNIEKPARPDIAIQSHFFPRCLNACRAFAEKLGLNFIYRYKTNMDFTNIENFAKKEMTHGGHDFSHAKRVFNLCKKILAVVPANPKIVLTAALIHDCVDYKFYKNTDVQYEKIKKLLTDEKFSDEEYEQVKWLCENTSFSKRVDLTGNYEAQTLADADRLEATGVIGIIRSIEFHSARGDNFTKGDDEIKFFASKLKENKNNYPAWAKENINTDKYTKDSPLFHINEKVMKISDHVYSDWAKKEAQKRIKFAVKFLREYFREVL